jgi:anti-sigma regulatory factor (Ser/Thr protein kinase)
VSRDAGGVLRLATHRIGAWHGWAVMSMRTAVAHSQHEAGFYHSDAEFGAMIMSWVEDGVAGGEPVVLGYDERKTRLLRSWLPQSPDVHFVNDRSLYANPPGAIATYRRMFERHTATGAARTRIAGDVPNPGNGGQFHGWDRYEIALNTVWEPFHVWSRCLYDAATTPAYVRDIVERSHPWLVSAAGESRANERFEDVGTFRALPVSADAITATAAPALELLNPSPARARRILRGVGDGLVDESRLDDLILGVSEAITNAIRHGRRPVRLQVWAAPSRLIAHVHDAGSGTEDPLVGLTPAPASAASGGRGLWITHQLDLTVDLLHTAEGFTVQLIAADSAAPAA